MPNVLRAASHQQSHVNSQAGPSSYPTGGFSIRTDIGRVDEKIVKAGDDDGGAKAFDATSDVADNNALVVKVHSQASGTEVAAGTDLSATTFTYAAYKL